MEREIRKGLKELSKRSAALTTEGKTLTTIHRGLQIIERRATEVKWLVQAALSAKATQEIEKG